MMGESVRTVDSVNVFSPYSAKEAEKDLGTLTTFKCRIKSATGKDYFIGVNVQRSVIGEGLWQERGRRKQVAIASNSKGRSYRSGLCSCSDEKLSGRTGKDYLTIRVRLVVCETLPEVALITSV
jgi:hypothetical protein